MFFSSFSSTSTTAPRRSASSLTIRRMVYAESLGESSDIQTSCSSLGDIFPKLPIFLTRLFPPGLGSRSCDSSALHLGHGLETALTADLTTFAPYCGHVFRQVGRCSRRRFWSRFLLLMRSLAGGLVNNPFCKLIRVSWTFAFADGHKSLL